MLRKLYHYAGFTLRFILGMEPPLLLGLVITDRCNQSCRQCRVSNTGRSDLTMEQIEEKLAAYHRRGFSELYIEGGEPFLWRDGAFFLEDVVALARRIGYFHVHVYTNGTMPINSSADRVWVSIDGLEADYHALRGDYFETVIGNIRDSGHASLGIVYTVNAQNQEGITPFLEFVVRECLPVKGVFFFFHTPYYGRDELFLDFDERSPAIHRIIDCKRQGLPVLNSIPALKAFERGNWKRPTSMFAVTDIDGDYCCCRNNSPEICEHCGYVGGVELDQARKLKLGAIRYFLNML